MAKTFTIADALVRALLARGHKEIDSPYQDYRRIKRQEDGRFYFIGRSGALKAGSNLSHSVSLTNTGAWLRLLFEGRHLLETERAAAVDTRKLS